MFNERINSFFPEVLFSAPGQRVSLVYEQDPPMARWTRARVF